MEKAMCRQVWESGVTCRDDSGLCRGDHIRCREAALPALARPCVHLWSQTGSQQYLWVPTTPSHRDSQRGPELRAQLLTASRVKGSTCLWDAGLAPHALCLRVSLGSPGKTWT